MMKLLITGGHLTPALAVIDYINNSIYQKNLELIFVGRQHISDWDKSLSLEFKEINIRGIKFISLKTGRFTRLISLRSLYNIFLIPLGFIQSLKILKSYKPDLILSFGGYIALPICICAYFAKIPVFTHEQTISPGIANKIIGFIAKKIFVSFSETKKYFNPKKTIFSGNPVRDSIFRTIKKPFVINKNRPVIYVTGGSTGSHSINMLIYEILPKLLIKYDVIHQTGDTKEFDDFKKLMQLKKKLPESLKSHYFIFKHFMDDEIGSVYSLADLVIGRSGANTFFELIALNKPAVFIPLPWSANKEQQKHAEIFVNNKVGYQFNQSHSSKELLTVIDNAVRDVKILKMNFKNLNNIYPKNVNKVIIKEILAE